MRNMMLLKDMYWDGSQIIDIEYKDTDGNITTRTVRLESVSPNPFSQHNNSLIFYGFCFLRNEYRTFKYSNILSIKVDGNIVNPIEFLSDYCGIKYDTRTLESKQKFPNGVMCITGTFSIPRAEIEAYIESCGFDIQQQIGNYVPADELFAYGNSSGVSGSNVKGCCGSKCVACAVDFNIGACRVNDGRVGHKLICVHTEGELCRLAVCKQRFIKSLVIFAYTAVGIEHYVKELCYATRTAGFNLGTVSGGAEGNGLGKVICRDTLCDYPNASVAVGRVVFSVSGITRKGVGNGNVAVFKFFLGCVNLNEYSNLISVRQADAAESARGVGFSCRRGNAESGADKKCERKYKNYNS